MKHIFRPVLLTAAAGLIAALAASPLHAQTPDELLEAAPPTGMLGPGVGGTQYGWGGPGVGGTQYGWGGPGVGETQYGWGGPGVGGTQYGWGGVGPYGPGGMPMGMGVPMAGYGVPVLALIIVGGGPAYYGPPYWGGPGPHMAHGMHHGAAVPQPIVCLVKPVKAAESGNEGAADANPVAVIAQTEEACSSIGGTLASAGAAQPPADGQ